MQLEKEIEFLRAKVRAIANSGALTAQDADGLTKSHESHFNCIVKQQSPVPSTKELDSGLETILRLAFRKKKDADKIRDELRQKFGFASLSATPELIAMRVLKRGAIRTDGEADQIRELLSEDTTNMMLGAGNALNLDKMLAIWDARK